MGRMTEAEQFSYQSFSPDQTKKLAGMLATHVQPGDVILLTGDLGAGKTQFAQGFAAALGVAEVPVSPTFNIVLSYESGRLPLYHFDLYRLDDVSQLDDIGLYEMLEGDGVSLVEWGEKFHEAFDEYVGVEITSDCEGTRMINATAVGQRPAELVREWARDVR